MTTRVKKAAYGILWDEWSEEFCYIIDDVYVKDDCRGQGYLRALLSRLSFGYSGNIMIPDDEYIQENEVFTDLGKYNSQEDNRKIAEKVGYQTESVEYNYFDGEKDATCSCLYAYTTDDGQAKICKYFVDKYYNKDDYADDEEFSKLEK